MSYRTIDENFWRSPRLAGLNLETKAIYNYLITQAGKTGFLYRSKKEHTSLLEVAIGVWDRGIYTLIERDRILVDEPSRIIWVKNQFRHQFRPDSKISPQQDKGIKNELASLPRTPLLKDFFERYRQRIEQDCPETCAFLASLPDLGGLTQPPKSDPKPKTEGPSEMALKLTHTFIARMLQNNPEAKVPIEGNGAFTAWAGVFEKMLVRDKKELNEIEKRIHWCQANHFWKKNCLSPEKLRKHYDRFTLEMRDEGAEWKKKPQESDDEQINLIRGTR